MKFEIKKTKKGRVIELLDGNGKPIMRGTRSYTRPGDATRAVERIQRESLCAAVEVV